MGDVREEQYPPEWMERVKKLGRVFIYNRVMWLSWSGTGIEWECEGGFTLKLKADEIPFDREDAGVHMARYALFCDGALKIDDRLDSAEKVIRISSEGVHTYRFIKLSESADSSLGITELSDRYGGCEGLSPVADKKLKIEVIGDSITCGYGVEGNLEQTYSTATENVTRSYSYIVPARLNADYSIVSKSGAGIISGYTDNGVRNGFNILTEYYDKMGCSVFQTGDAWPSDFDYDYSFEPDIIIVNLGTNDMSYCSPADPAVRAKYTDNELLGRQKEFCGLYKKFIEHLRENNPFAKIVCTLGIMGEALNSIVEMVVSMQIAEGDRRIFWLPLKDQDPENGYGVDYHPSEKTQALLADTVADFVEKVLRKEV